MRAPPLPIDAYPFVSEHDLRFSDLDPLGHANNAVFGSLMENNRTRMLQSYALGAEAAALVIARFEIDYLAELHWPGTVRAATAVESIGRTSMRLRQAIFDGVRCVAVAVAVIVTIDRASRRPVALPDDLRTTLQGLGLRAGG